MPSLTLFQSTVSERWQVQEMGMVRKGRTRRKQVAVGDTGATS